MEQLVTKAPAPSEEVKVYIAGLRSALGSRDPFEVLRETPGELRRAIEGLGSAALSTPEAPGKWSIRQVLQHLADAELVGGFRYRMVLAHDRPLLAGYDQDLWADRLRYNEADVEAALEDFARLRRANLRLLERTSPQERERVGLHAERGEESIADLLTNFAGHDLVHRRQIARIRQAVDAGR
jgi:uncharacterized damage-inducible protein DinB